MKRPDLTPQSSGRPKRIENKRGNSFIATPMATAELIKNNKAFRIRNMYKPKTWVVQIEVRDTGPGIEPALQEKVFEPFVQGDQTLSRSYGGTGLGLSICRQLATMMKGTLTLKSAIGVGSIFTFTVPLPQTGEILVDESEMGEFCEDEFNPKARVNRKVAFKNSTMDVDNPTHHEYENDELSEKDDFVEMSPLRPQPPPSRVRTDSVPRSDSSGDSPRQENSDSPGSSGSFQLLGKVDPPRTTYEKPHLITRSSTGTANSANASDRLDLHHNILDDLSDLKILVAEDNLVNQEVIKRMLKLEGFTNITLACNGAEAVELTKESIEKDEIFDLIFMDVQMPKIDGLLATRMIRTNLRFENPIIALTAFADESNVKECLNSGMSGFLSKPIRRTNLRKIIVEFSPVLLSEIVTTPQTHQSDEKRLGYPPTNLGSSA